MLGLCHRRIIRKGAPRRPCFCRPQTGFTIAELSLSMAFIAFLLIAIAALIMYAIFVYQKGVTLRNVNSAGLELIDEFTRTVSGSGNAIPDCQAAGFNTGCNSDSLDLVYYQAVGQIRIVRENVTRSVPTWGIFCTGAYSYAWNTGYVTNTDGTYASGNAGTSLQNMRLNLKVGGSSNNNFRLLRFEDPSRTLCVESLKTASGATRSHEITIDSNMWGNRRELFNSAAETSLAVYDLRIFNPVYHKLTGHAFFTGSFVIGTITGSVDIATTNNVCKDAPDGLSTDFAYCAINKFNFAIRASGSK